MPRNPLEWDNPPDSYTEPGYVDWSKLPPGSAPTDPPSFGGGTTTPAPPGQGGYAPPEKPIDKIDDPKSVNPLQTTMALPGGGKRTTDPGLIGNFIQQWATQTKADPSLANDPNYWIKRITETGGLGEDNLKYWQDASYGDSAFYLNPSRESGGIFSDPATAQYESLLNGLIGRLNTPYNAPDFQPAVDYLRTYFKQLQQPVYTQGQRDVIQTQAIDPLTQQRDVARQNIIQHFAQQGIPPSSGIVQKALLDSDQSFEKLNTQVHSNFAANEIHQGQQNQQQAASLGPLIAQLEQQQFAGNEGRQFNAANLAGIIPALAWQRLTGANNTIQQTNPLSAINLLNLFQNQGYNQGQNYGSGLAQIIAAILGAG